MPFAIASPYFAKRDDGHRTVPDHAIEDDHDKDRASHVLVMADDTEATVQDR